MNERMKLEALCRKRYKQLDRAEKRLVLAKQKQQYLEQNGQHLTGHSD